MRVKYYKSDKTEKTTEICGIAYADGLYFALVSPNVRKVFHPIKICLIKRKQMLVK